MVSLAAASRCQRQPRALVLVPTRELAAQVQESIRTYGKYLRMRSTVIFGGVGMQPQVDTLRRGAAYLIYWFSIMGGGFFMIVAWFYWVALELALPAKLHAHLHTLQPGYAPGFKWLAFSLALFYSLGWVFVLLKLRKSRERPVLAWTSAAPPSSGRACS